MTAGRSKLRDLLFKPAGHEESLPPFWDRFLQKDPPPPPPPAPPGSAAAFDPETVFWAMRALPATEAVKHFLVCGAIGSGKTITLRLLLQSIARRFHSGAGGAEQLIVFDAKGDMVSLLQGLGLSTEDDHVHLLNPFDERSSVWNLGEATQSPLMARALAALLIPEERNTTAPYFTDASRELVHAVLLALNQVAGTAWSFRDLLCAFDSKEHVLAVCRQHPRADKDAKRILGDGQHAPAVLSTLGTKLGRFEQVAALWHTSPRRKPFSIPEFLQRPGVLILGNDPVLRESFWPINAILLKALANEVLRGPETLRPRHWFLLDELRAMERLDSVQDLLNRGRSKGVSMILGIQSIEGLCDVYGDHAANDLLGQCANKTFLRAGSHKTAQWAEEHFGKVRRLETSVTETRGFESNSTAWNQSIQERSMFLASFFLDLPLPGDGGRYTAVCDVPSFRETLIVDRPFEEVKALLLPRANVDDLKPRTDLNHQTLQPWTATQEELFCPGLKRRELKPGRKRPPNRPDHGLPPLHGLDP